MRSTPEDTERLLNMNVLELRIRTVEFSDVMKKVYMACVEWRSETFKHATSGQIAELAGIPIDEAQATLKLLANASMIDYEDARRKVRWVRFPNTYLEWMEKVNSWK